MRGKVIVGLLVLAAVAMYGAFQYRKSLAPKSAQSEPFRSGADQASAAPQAPGGESAVSPPAAARAPSFAAPSDPQFQQWIRDEARSLDSLSVDGEKKQAEIRAIVSKINPNQARQLGQTIMSPESKTPEKILSAYLLVEGGLNTREELRKTITAPLTQKGGEPHSEQELDGVREKSLRIMLIDGLAAQAQKDPKARETLAQAIVDSEDPYIRAYAQRKYDELSQF